MFVDKIVLITGGTKGIGKSTALEFLKQGACVAAVYSKDDGAAQAMRDSLPVHERGRLLYFKGSVKEVEFLQLLLKQIELKFKKLNIVINSAGITKDDLFLDMEEDDWSDVIETNLKGTLNTTLLAAELMKRSDGPRYIVNIASISGVHGRAAQANYACSKGGVIGITKLLAKKFAKDHISVNTIIPGLIETGMAKKLPDEKREEALAATALKRIGQPEEIAKTIMSLVGGNFSYTSGTCIKVDGGYLK